ncbi:hypothetical protein AZE42_08663 [Rhizopogon vesiculosus]|uniref:Uncharacterized protein n=1 Tax=Rhizopogon vesiculosus TaxID=180088 RepID=A0A1J8QAF3_9AGAM|nr:hypothetical protein AZE42_08663 [Rhizopogon vesiculosus]
MSYLNLLHPPVVSSVHSSYTTLAVGSSDVVSVQMSGSLGFRRVNLKILWPGYEHLDRTHPLDLYTPAGPLTRSQLAVQVAHAFARFIDVCPSPVQVVFPLTVFNRSCKVTPYPVWHRLALR